MKPAIERMEPAIGRMEIESDYESLGTHKEAAAPRCGTAHRSVKHVLDHSHAGEAFDSPWRLVAKTIVPGQPWPRTRCGAAVGWRASAVHVPSLVTPVGYSRSARKLQRRCGPCQKASPRPSDHSIPCLQAKQPPVPSQASLTGCSRCLLTVVSSRSPSRCGSIPP